MSIRSFFKRKDGLPDPKWSLSSSLPSKSNRCYEQKRLRRSPPARKARSMANTRGEIITIHASSDCEQKLTGTVSVL